MAVYSLPPGFVEDVPTWDLDKSRVENEKTEAEWLERLKRWCMKRKPAGKCVGEIAKFPVADGYAMYMVASLKPLQIIHLPIGDAWSYQHANRLTAKDIQGNIGCEKALAKIFGNRG